MTDDPLEPALILIIDDNVGMIRLLSSLLSEQGQILFATSGEAGLKIARERRPQLILLDVEMAGMDGYEVCRRIKADPDAGNCALIFVTAHDSMESEVAALEAGAVDFISKPLNPPVVRARVRTHLKLQLHAEAMVRLANRDGLTGLFNRRYFNEMAEKEFQRSRRQALPLALAFVDIDHFKAYNDSYGHQAGDTALVQVAQAICAATRRPGEVMARYGGEEFVALLPHTNADEATRYGEWLVECVRGLQMEHAHAGASGHVSISVGMTAFVPNRDDTLAGMIELADQALYLAKSSGRDRAILKLKL
ncbi:MAG: diguanylate cyclase [Pseudomonadota bacterium]